MSWYPVLKTISAAFVNFLTSKFASALQIVGLIPLISHIAQFIQNSTVAVTIRQVVDRNFMMQMNLTVVNGMAISSFVLVTFGIAFMVQACWQHSAAREVERLAAVDEDNGSIALLREEGGRLAGLGFGERSNAVLFQAQSRVEVLRADAPIANQDIRNTLRPD